MKCNVSKISNKMRKAIDGYTKHRVAEHYEKQGEEITRRNFKLFCLALAVRGLQNLLWRYWNL